MRVPGFSGTDPTFLSIAISLALTYEYAPRPWGWECVRPNMTEQWIVFPVASATAALLLRLTSRLAWIAASMIALLTWQYFAPNHIDRGHVWLFAIPERLSQSALFGLDRFIPAFVFCVLYLGTMVAPTASARRDLRVDQLLARVGTGLVAAVTALIAAEVVIPSLEYVLQPYWLKYVVVADYLLPAVVTPLLVWRFVLTRRLVPQWIGAMLATPLTAVGLYYLTRGRLVAHPADAALLLILACTGPAWAIRDWSAHRRNAGSRGFDVVLSSSATPQR